MRHGLDADPRGSTASRPPPEHEGGATRGHRAADADRQGAFEIWSRHWQDRRNAIRQQDEKNAFGVLFNTEGEMCGVGETGDQILPARVDLGIAPAGTP